MSSKLTNYLYRLEADLGQCSQKIKALDTIISESNKAIRSNIEINWEQIFNTIEDGTSYVYLYMNYSNTELKDEKNLLQKEKNLLQKEKNLLQEKENLLRKEKHELRKNNPETGKSYQICFY